MIYIISLYYVPGFHIQNCEQNHWILSKTGHLLKKDIFNGVPFAGAVNHTQSRKGSGVRCFTLKSEFSMLIASDLSSEKCFSSIVENNRDPSLVICLFSEIAVRCAICYNRQQNKPKNPTTTVPKKETILVLPYLGVQSKIVTKQLKTCIKKFYGCIDLRVIFQSARRIKSFFPYKDMINRSQLSNVV